MNPPILTRDDIAQAVQILGCEEAAIKAVIEVEAGGKGFDAKGRPTILFEPHVFERELNAAGIPDTHPVIIHARKRGLCSPTWNKALYGPTADARWAQVEGAMGIHQEAAFKSVSYGIGQVLGQNHLICGFETAPKMLNVMCHSEGHQLLAMINFIKRRGLADELQRRDWAGFAHGYNGRQYHLNSYDVKLQRAYERHRADPSAFWTSRRNIAQAS